MCHIFAVASSGVKKIDAESGELSAEETCASLSSSITDQTPVAYPGSVGSSIAHSPQMLESVSNGGRAETYNEVAGLESAELALGSLCFRGKNASTPAAGPELTSPELSRVGENGETSNGLTDSPRRVDLEIELDAVTAELRERQDQLELVAHYGQNLLERNAELKSDLLAASASRDDMEEERDRLKHKLAVKEQLMKLYAQEMEEAEEAMRAMSPPYSNSAVSVCSSTLSEETAALLAEECLELREHNRYLAEQVKLLEKQTEVLERRETELIGECVRRLNDSSEEISDLRRRAENREELSTEHASLIKALQEDNARLNLAHRQLEAEKLEMEESLNETNAKHGQLATTVSVCGRIG